MNSVVILGRLRSGGSAVASLLVPMGYSPGVTLSAPCPPTWRIEWDDVDLTKALLHGSGVDIASAMAACFERARNLKSDALFKNAYLAIPWFGVLDVFEHIGGCKPFVIRTVRNEPDRQRSLEHTFHTIAGGRELDASVTEAVDKIVPDYMLSYDVLQDDMSGELDRLCLAMEEAQCLGQH